MDRGPAQALDPAGVADLWDFADPAGSERRLRARRDAAERGSPAWQELTTQVARALGLQGRVAEAHALLDEVAPRTPAVSVRVALERGRLHNSAGAPLAAVPSFVAAFTEALAAGLDWLAADAAHMLAIADPARAERWTARGLEVAGRSRAAARWRGALHTNLGWLRHDREDFEAALASFEAALVAYTETGSAEEVHAAWWAVARCLRSLGRVQEAWEIQSRLAQEGPWDPEVEEELTALRLLLGG